MLTIQDYKAGISATVPQTQTFTYDHLDRLRTAVATGGASGNGNFNTETYTYTVTGNLTGKAGMTLNYPANSPTGGVCTSGTPTTKPHAVASTTGGSPNFSYAYDCNGNVITRTVGATAYTLTYDAENRLTG